MRYLKNQVIQGTLILTIAGFITRLIGFIYRVYLSDTIGSRLLGVYQLIFPVYGICFTIYASGIQTAISQKIASITEDSDASMIKRHKKELSYFKTGLFASLFLAFVLSFFVFGFADQIASHLLLEKSCTVYLKILCILFPFCGISACINGFFYGKKEAKYPAVSQIVEQLSRVFIVILLCTFLPYSALINSYFAVCGLVFGEIMASVYNMIRFGLAQKEFIKCHSGRNTPFHTTVFSKSSFPDTTPLETEPKTKQKLSRSLSFPVKATLKQKHTIKNSLLFLAITLTGTKLILSILHSAESVFIPAALRKYGYSAANALSTYGILSGVALPFILFPDHKLFCRYAASIHCTGSSAKEKRNDSKIRFSLRKMQPISWLFFYLYFSALWTGFWNFTVSKQRSRAVYQMAFFYLSCPISVNYFYKHYQWTWLYTDHLFYYDHQPGNQYCKSCLFRTGLWHESLPCRIDIK